MNIFYYHIIDFLSLIYYQLKLILPFWIGGIVLGGILSVYLSERISKFMDKLNEYKHQYIAIFIGSLIGAISPITMYGMVPIVLLFYKRGMPSSILTSFIITSVLINPNVFFYSFALGLDIALLRLFVTVLAGYIGGLLVMAFLKNKEVFDFKGKDKNSTPNQSKHKTAIQTMLKTIKKTLPYLLIGVIITALFEKFVPKNVFESMFISNQGLGALFGSALGVPLYFCGGGSIALILSWMNNGMTTGSVMAFIVSGPATKINNITAIAAMTKKKYVILYLAYIISFSVVAGTLIDFIL